MYQPSLKREQPAQYLPNLLNSSDGNERQKGYDKRDECDYTDLSQFDQLSICFLLIENILFEYNYEEGEGRIEVDMLEVQKNTIYECSFCELFATNELYAQEEDSLHDDVVLEVDIYVVWGLLSRIMKGNEKQATTIFAFIYLKIQKRTNK